MNNDSPNGNDRRPDDPARLPPNRPAIPKTSADSRDAPPKSSSLDGCTTAVYVVSAAILLLYGTCMLGFR